MVLAALAVWQSAAPRPAPALAANGERPDPPPPLQSTASSIAESRGLYHARPDHIWNRLYRHFYIRTTLGGKEYGYDSLDPLLWHETTYLLSGPSHEQAIRLLDEFLSTRAESLITDPLKRALLQRDLWAIFDWAAFSDYKFQPQRRELQIRLAQAIQRLALSAAQINALPDNYALAIASKTFAAQHNPAERERAFLPPDLFQSDGPWVCLSDKKWKPVAPSHVSDITSRGRSVFLVFLRLPEGRAATLAYLKKLPEVARSLNPPQFPPGTQVALVRQMVLINEQGNLTPSRLTENIQFRVYRAIKGGELNTPEDNEVAREAQGVYEFRLSRAKLFAGAAGGLRPLARDEEEPRTFSSHGVDLFERPSPSEPLRLSPPILRSCAQCHFRPGIYSVLSYFPFVGPPRDLTDSNPSNEAALIGAWKRHQYDWGLLEGMWRMSRVR
jgi:hypothetical protein